MQRASLVLALVVPALAPALAHAEASVAVQLSPDGQQLANELGVSAADLEAQIKGSVDDAYQTANVDSFLQSFTDATSFSARGLGTDYASAPKGFMIGFAINVAASGDPDITGKQVPTAGLAANLGAMVGLNLSGWNLPGWTVFANGFYRNASTDRLSGNILSLGGHLQYRIVQPSADGGAGTAVRWIGLSVTSGVELTKWKLGAGNEPLSTDFDVGGGNGQASIVLDSTGRFDLSSTAVTIPVEVTTGLRVALLASVFVGAGIDITAGKSSVNATLNGTMHTSDNRDVGTVTVTEKGEHAGSPGAGRILAGAQVNLSKLKIGAQVNVSLTPAASVGLYARLAF